MHQTEVRRLPDIGAVCGPAADLPPPLAAKSNAWSNGEMIGAEGHGMTDTIEVELPGTGEPILDVGAVLLFLREYDAELARCGDLADYTTADIRAELARRADSAPHEG